MKHISRQGTENQPPISSWVAGFVHHTHSAGELLQARNRHLARHHQAVDEGRRIARKIVELMNLWADGGNFSKNFRVGKRVYLLKTQGDRTELKVATTNALDTPTLLAYSEAGVVWDYSPPPKMEDLRLAYRGIASARELHALVGSRRVDHRLREAYKDTDYHNLVVDWDGHAKNVDREGNLRPGLLCQLVYAGLIEPIQTRMLDPGVNFSSSLGSDLS